MKPRNISFPTKTNKIDKILLRLIKKKREGTQIKKTRNEREVTIHKTETHKHKNKQIRWTSIISQHRIDEFPEISNLQQPNQEEIEQTKY